MHPGGGLRSPAKALPTVRNTMKNVNGGQRAAGCGMSSLMSSLLYKQNSFTPFVNRKAVKVLLTFTMHGILNTLQIIKSEGGE